MNKLKKFTQALHPTLKNIPKERLFLGILSILSVGFIFYQSTIIFQIKKLKAVDLKYISQKKLADYYGQIAENANALKVEYEDAQKSFLKIKERFISEEDLPNYFTHFRELAKSHNLKVLELEFQPQEPVLDNKNNPLTYFQKLRFNASLKGDYLDAMRLLDELEYVSPKIFQLQKVHIKQQDYQSRQVVTDIDVIVYIFNEKKQNEKL